MNRIALPKQDFTLSEYAAGFWRLKNWGYSKKVLHDFVQSLLDGGVTTMDQAMVYQSEGIFGDMLAAYPGVRSKIEIISKCGIRPPGFGALGANKTAYYDSSPEAIMVSVHHSLQQLQTDHLDILLLHRPDYLMDVYAVAEAFNRLKTEGKVRAFGVSNFSTSQFETLNQALEQQLGQGLVTNQVEFSVFEPALLASGVLEQCQSHRISPMFWSCLGGGRIADPKTEAEKSLLAAAKQLAEKYDVFGAEAILYAWARRLPGNPIILLGSSKIERLLEAVRVQDLELEKEDWYALLELALGKPVD